MAADMRTRAIGALIGYFLIVFIIGFAGQADLIQLIAGFIPSLIFMVFIYSAYHVLDQKLVLALPALLVAFFIGFGYLNVPVIKDTEFVLLGGVNLLLCYGILGIVTGAQERKPRKRHPHYYTPHVKEAPVHTPKTVQENMQTIIANCKALNHVIGRVYTKRNGGSETLRQRIRIPPEVYHDIEQSLKQKKMGRVKELLEYLQQKVNLFSHPERSVFGHVKLKNISRREDGTNTIEQVLIHNDADPVHDYLMSIRKSIKFIEQKVRASEI